MASQAPGPDYVWISSGLNGEDPSAGGGGYWAPNPYATLNTQPAPAANTVAGPNSAATINANWQMSQPLQNQFAELLTNPVSGYSPVANYGAQLGRFQFSHTAPVPATAPVGWGRYPGTGGSPPPPKWLTNPTTPPLPTANPPGSYVGGGGSSGGSGNGAGNGGYTSAYPPGYTPGSTPPSTQGWMPGPATSQVSSNTLSGFKFANAAPGSVQANFNAIQAKYGPQDAISYLILNGQNNGAWRQFTNSLQAGGMSEQDVARIQNQFSAGGSGGIFNNNLAGFNGGVYSNGTDQTGLLASLGIQDTSARDALAAWNAQQKKRLGR